MGPGFPPELVDKVIEEHGTDTLTLRSCALVCQSFLRPSQSHIFSNIHLTPTNTTNYSRRLHLALQGSPHLRSYILGLKLTETGTSSSLVAGDPDLIPLIQMLIVANSKECRPFRSFEFEAFSAITANWRLNWDDLPQELRTGICTLCMCSPLIKLRLSNLGKFTELDEFASLVTSPYLAHLALNVKLHEGGTAAPRPIPSLTRCRLVVSTPVLSRLISWLGPFVHLRSLYLYWDHEDTSQIQRIIDTAALSLEELSLVAIRRCASAFNQSRSPRRLTPNRVAVPDTQDIVVLTRATALRVLELRFLLVNVEEFAALAPWLAGMFRGASALTNIAVRIGPVRLSGPTVPVEPIEWALALTNIFEPTTLPALQRVVLEIVPLVPSFEEPLQLFMDGVERGLRGFGERGVSLECLILVQSIEEILRSDV
ncbi:hypothetical protein DFH09DRAFT_1330775 [Mycena vulgaris]|nr:hypothetical protein DFH09DRAFT_1330775 [Mycena vulgaris]